MKFLPLAWAGLWRRPVRTSLTAACILVAFVLLGLLEGVNAGFERSIENAHRDFLVTGPRVRGGGQMPIASISTLGGAQFDAQLVYSLNFTPSLVLRAVALACFLGLAGGLLPALHAARVNIAEGLQET